jgi:hypothetical protein
MGHGILKESMSGQEVVRADISAMTNSVPCTITTTAAHGFITGQYVRLTDLNSSIPVLRGMDQLNNKRFRVVVLDTTSFYLENPITYEKIDSTSFPAYVTGGYCTLVQNKFNYSGD